MSADARIPYFSQHREYRRVALLRLRKLGWRKRLEVKAAFIALDRQGKR